jgi:hypothetical protein
MSRRLLFVGLFSLLLVAPWASAGDEFKSGPQPGEKIPGSFNPFNINGKHGKLVKDRTILRQGSHHCLVTDFELRPVVLVFARESTDDKLLMDLLKQIDQAVEKNNEAGGEMRSFAVFLSPFGTDTVIEATLPEDKRTTDPEKLVELAVGRKMLIKQLDQRAANFKNLIVAYYHNGGPAAYKIHPAAEITILLYENYKVEANFAFQENQITAVSVDEIMKAVNALAGKGKKKAATDS